MIFFINIEMTTYWIDLGQLGMSIRMLGHETMPGYKKKIKTNYEV